MSRTRFRRSSTRHLWNTNPQSILPFLGTILMGLVGYVGCEPDGKITIDASRIPGSEFVIATNSVGRPHYVSTATSGGLPARSDDTILVASFNIQAFGVKKLDDRWVIDRLAEIVRRFDLVAIQEIRAMDQSLLTKFVSHINAHGARYNFLLGPRLGDTSSQEQYAYIFDSDRIITNQQCMWTFNDDINLLHREPLIGRFLVRSNRTSQPWSFSLVNLHTDPDVAQREVDSMGGILRSIRSFEFSDAREDDVILLGDLNLGPEKMQQIQNVASMFPTILGTPTNVRRSAAYDNIVLDPSTTSEFTGRRGVLDMSEVFDISLADALKLSDHNPVWAEFRVQEQGVYAQPQFAQQPYYGVR